MTPTTAPLTFRKTAETYAIHPFNPLKLLAHKDRIDRMLAGERVFPISVELDLSLKCSHACAWCSFDQFRLRNWVNFPTPRVLTLIDELADCGVKSVTLTGGGEPLVHQAAPDVMRKLTARGLQWGLVTNGWQLTGTRAALVAEHATFCRVSLDAGVSTTHQRIHSVAIPQFDQILDHMADVRRQSKRLTLGASFCVFDSNIEEIRIAAQKVKALGANYLEVRPVYPTEWRGGAQGDNGISDENIDLAKVEIAEARRTLQDESFQIIGMVDRFDAIRSFRHRDYYDACRITSLSTVISSDGNIYACCVTRGLDPFKGGSVLDKPFADVWLGRERADMEATIDIDKCPKCRYVGLNSTLASACASDGMHANFI